jgi:hypothetical protein
VAQGFDLSGLTDEQLSGDWTVVVFPNVALSGLFAHKHFLSRHRPHPSDPGRMLLDYQEYTRLPRGARQERPPHRRFRYGEQPLSPTVDQDVSNCLEVQKGLGSRALADFGLLLGDNEIAVRHLHEQVDAFVRG